MKITTLPALSLAILGAACSSTVDTTPEKTPTVSTHKEPVTIAARADSDAIVAESFENGGWNAASPRGFTPGLNTSLPKNFMFNQLQTDKAFSIEDTIVRSGEHSAKLYWQHKNPAAFNDDKTKIDNVDRKAMFHGFKTKDVLGAEAWYGFSVYFPSEGTADEENPWLFFQIHGSADKRLKERSRNPPFSITLTPDGLAGSWKWDDDEHSKTRNGKETEYYTIPGAKANYLDRWVDFVVHVKVDYTEASNGVVELWVDDKKVLDEQNTRFGYNDDKGIYPSWGMYFNGKLDVMNNDHYLYLDDIKMCVDANTQYNDVKPG